MREGFIAAVKLDKGFGFVAELCGPEVFFHASSLVGLDFDELLIGRRIRFDVVSSPRGFEARNIRAAD
jgi:CspA family cold shock protein